MNKNKNRQAILNKLKIEQLNPMQDEAGLAISSGTEIVLLSPTGTGKTVAFLLPIIEALEKNSKEIQVLILVPSRELAIQIWQVIKEMGSGFKSNAVYGGRPVSQDKRDLKHLPAILVGTPGRVADHLRRGTFSGADVHTLVLDEFDKSLEVGFEKEMMEIIDSTAFLEKKILTSATFGVQIPDFVKIKKPLVIDYLEQKVSQLHVKLFVSADKDKMETLGNALKHLGSQPGIVFCNFKDSIRRVSDFLSDLGIEHGCFYGGLEQHEREEALVKFRNGTHQLLIATDLAARGIDVPEIKFIIHYHLPIRSEEFIHRNGRTARMNADGTAYVLKWANETLPDFIHSNVVEEILKADIPQKTSWETIRISGGRRDKISKGDIAGLCFKVGDIKKDQLGIIELKQNHAFIAVKNEVAIKLRDKINRQRLKKTKIRASLLY